MFLNIALLVLGAAILTTAVFMRHSMLYVGLGLVVFGGYFGLPENNWLIYLLFVLGLVLVIIEFYVPDFGITGLIGLVVMVISFYLVHDDVISVLIAVIAFLATTLITGAIHLAMGRELQISPQFILNTSMNSESGYSSSKNFDYLIDQKGVTVTALRPVGRASFDGELFEVVSNEDMLPADTPIYVERVEGSKIYVRKEG
ncbi:NfeD family protein [Fundicoccus culcitae]|uniref:NfeD-like C-terminal domain-containing protein n=1 Tax=Fundicoccus culcitae TaxID=2969821 RepID=A0ABY5P8E2_9LACT|nr:NfeD family protein [Fundicoccus culcitae]UUX34650.1 hypothetical protein NRE15_03080 [Fundicoccus culcitae]